ncbi:Formylglycine-generating sulfatase enzyme [Sphingomonas sp. RIT328]|nr:Formylglycine-generating sulfatase enzyme [Sphingomonas sp. RIT328]
MQPQDHGPDLPQMVPFRHDAPPFTDFALSTREVTWKQYLQSVDQAGCPMPQTSSDADHEVQSARDPRIRDGFPVTGVSAKHVACYITWLNHAANAAYRLPTLIEWQIAARTAQPRLWSSWERTGAAALVRSDPRESVREATVQVVASGPPTSDGIFDLEGNAGELLSDMDRLSGRESERCVDAGPDVPLVTGLGGYSVERGSGREKPGDFRAVLHSICGAPMISVGFRLAASPPPTSKRSQLH